MNSTNSILADEEAPKEASSFTPQEEEEDNELSYAEILASAVFNGEIVITIPMEDEERVKNGIKNFKSKNVTKSKEEGLPVDTSILNFIAEISKDFAGCIDLHIISKTRGTVKIKKLRIPEGEIPD